MWKVWIGPKAGFVVASGVGEECTDGAGAVFGAIANVSWLNRPTYSWWAQPATVGLEVALVPGHPEREVGHLDHEGVELGVARQPPGVDGHPLDLAVVLDGDPAARIGEAAGGGNPGRTLEIEAEYGSRRRRRWRSARARSRRWPERRRRRR